MKQSRYMLLALASLLVVSATTEVSANQDALKGLMDKASDQIKQQVTQKASDALTKTLTGQKEETVKLAGTNWQGRFTAADASGDDVTLSLGADGLYRRVDHYLTDKPGATILEMGTWTMKGKDSAALVSSDGSKSWFRLEKDGSLILTNEDGATAVDPSMDSRLKVSEKADLFTDQRFIDRDADVSYAGTTQIENGKKVTATLTLRGDSSYRLSEEAIKDRHPAVAFSWGRWSRMNEKTVLLVDARGYRRYLVATPKGYAFANQNEKVFNGKLLMTKNKGADLFAESINMNGDYLQSKDSMTMTVAGLGYPVARGGESGALSTAWDEARYDGPVTAEFKGHFVTVKAETGSQTAVQIDRLWKLGTVKIQVAAAPHAVAKPAKKK